MFDAKDPSSAATSLADMMAYCAQLKSSEAFELIIEDAQLESNKTDIFDFVFAHQISTFNTQGIVKPKR